MNTLVDGVDIAELDGLDAAGLLEWASERFGSRAGIVTSFQNTGSVILDMAQRVAPGMRVITIDTLRLPSETYELIGRVEAYYGIQIERFTPDAERLRRMVSQHGEYLFFDSKEKQEYCCQVRKVEPNQRVLATLDAWVSGLRRDQSESRSGASKAAVVEKDGRTLLKLNPLADWTEAQVTAYIRERGIPYNTLYDKGYRSIGCFICSTPTRSSEDKRAGRWRWFNHLGPDSPKECGIHGDGGGI